MRSSALILTTALICSSVFTACDQDEEAEVIAPANINNNNGGGGNGGGGGGGNNTYPITGQGVFSCTINSSEAYLFEEDDPDRQMTFGNYDFSGPTRRSFECRFFDSTEYETQAAVSLRYLEYSSTDPTDGEFNGFFHTGDYPIAGLMSAGAVIYMWKPEWSAPRSSDLVFSQPSDAHFTVTDVQPFIDGGMAKVKVRATFKCSISTGMGNTTLSDGVFVGVFGKID